MSENLARVSTLHASGALDQARDALREITAGRLQEQGEHREWGLLAERLGLVGIAERELNLALRDDPKDRLALEHLVELALERGAFERAANLLERVLDLDPLDLASTVRLLDLYDSMGATPRAAALRQRAIAAGLQLPRPVSAEPEVAPTDADPALPTDADLVRFLAVFGGREDVYARQWYSPQRGEGGYAPVREPLTPRQLRQHFLGDVTLGVYPIRLDGTCVFCALDVDLTRAALEEAQRQHELARVVREELRTATVEIASRLQAAGLPHLIEDSGYKGRHFWMFLAAPEPAATLVALGRAVMAMIATAIGPHLALEWFPKASRPGTRGLGNLIKLPLGVHRRTGRRSVLLDAQGNVVVRPWETLRNQPRLARDVILRVIDTVRQTSQPVEEASLPAEESQVPEAASPPSVTVPARPEWTAADFEASAVFRRLLARCEVLAALRRKAEEERRLTHEETIVLTHTLGHLPGGVAALNYLLGLCLNVPRSAFLVSPLRGNPVSCPKIRARIPHVTSRCRCACTFPESPEHYPTPLLHVQGLDPEELTPPKARPVPEDEVRRMLLLQHRLRELDRELAAVRSALVATMRERPERRWELAEGTLDLVETDGVAELRWTPRGDGTGE